MRNFRCQCGNTVCFENTQCLGCGRALGFLPDHLLLGAIEPIDGERYRALAPVAAGVVYRACKNYHEERVCNWMVPETDNNAFCRACRLNQMIPNLAEPRNRVLWARIERAKRRLLYTLFALGLPVHGRDEAGEQGLAFEFLADPEVGGEFTDEAGAQRVLTGHRRGLVTINIAEADPGMRESMRERMREQYRTLLGHFRHEIAHHYWERLVAGGTWLTEFRELFGDERTEYDAALRRYYAEGPSPEWQQSFVSAYAAAHPWEDFAETWAHYLHMVDTLETASDYGFSIRGRALRSPATSVNVGVRQQAGNPPPAAFEELLADWIELTLTLNALNRSMGLRDAYPFALSPGANGKLAYVHRLIAAHAR